MVVAVTNNASTQKNSSTAYQFCMGGHGRGQKAVRRSNRVKRD